MWVCHTCTCWKNAPNPRNVKMTHATTRWLLGQTNPEAGSNVFTPKKKCENKNTFMLFLKGRQAVTSFLVFALSIIRRCGGDFSPSKRFFFLLRLKVSRFNFLFNPFFDFQLYLCFAKKITDLFSKTFKIQRRRNTVTYRGFACYRRLIGRKQEIWLVQKLR